MTESAKDLSYTSHVGRDLRGVNLSGADLRRAIFDGADLEKANLSGSDLRDASLKRANLKMAALDGVDLRGARMRTGGMPRWMTRCARHSPRSGRDSSHSGAILARPSRIHSGTLTFSLTLFMSTHTVT